MNLRTLRTYLLSSCRYLQTTTAVEQPQNSGLWVEWVVARSLCVYRSVDISSVSASELDAFLRMQVREWAPFDMPEYHVQLFGSRALVWAWDGLQRKEASRAEGVTPDTVLPESILYTTAPQEESVYVELVECIEGFEARGYRAGRQVQSRWWPEQPDLRSWNQLRMLFDLAPDTSVPEATAALLPDGQETSVREVVFPFLLRESTLFVAAFALFIVFAAYQGAGLAYANLAMQQGEGEIAELNQAVTPVLEARDRALESLDAIENMSSLHAGPLQLQYIADLLGRLEQARQAGQDINLMAWEFRQSRVSISVTADGVTADELLAVFEGIPWLQEQRVGDDTVKGRKRVTAGLLPDWRFVDDAPQQVAGS